MTADPGASRLDSDSPPSPAPALDPAAGRAPADAPPPPSPAPPGLVAAWDLARRLPLAWPSPPNSPDAVAWIHLDRHAPQAAAWLRDHAGIDERVTDELLAESTRPRAVSLGTGLLVLLRGVNLNPGADPEDMLSIRLWIEPVRVVSLQGGPLRAVEAIIGDLAGGQGPATASELLVDIASGLIERMVPIIEDVAEQLDDLEDRLLAPDGVVERGELVTVRRRVITLHRYMLPQELALEALASSGTPLLNEHERESLREAAVRLTRLIEDLEAARGRGALIQDELSNQLAERANTRIYLLSVLAAVFLPLTLLSGMLGMNVGGIPLGQSPWGFAIVCVLCVLVAVGVWLSLRRSRWL